ncbi:MAG: hypothetical protein M1814_004921 [Vezdaea aestivalis]|nr:MAG: hypothetical protein M1814_004921 [Vezdaea aestivalis]
MSLLHPPAHLPPSIALQQSQLAPQILQKTARAPRLGLPFLGTPESPESWTSLENLLLSCLRTRDDASAKQCLERLTERFGGENERVLALRGLYAEAVAETDADLRAVLKGYDKTLEADASNIPIAKRRVALLRSMGKYTEAITALSALADVSPTDAEIWTELSDLYCSQAMFAQAVFSLEEALLIVPNAWNLHARLAEMLYVSATGQNVSADTSVKTLLTSVKRFCRSVELCEDYPRGYYGLKMATSRLVNGPYKQPRVDEDEEEPASLETLQRLNKLATDKLRNVVKQSAGKRASYDPAEMIAIRELLDRDV